jgi:tetratricopeptide (TPR) repeat protein
MLIDLIRQASKILSEKSPTDDDLQQAENSISSYLEALATERVSEQVSLENIEDANRLLKEIRRERARRLAGQTASPDSQAIEMEPQLTSNNSKPIIRSPKLDSDEQPDALKKFIQSSHDPEAEKLMDQAEEDFYRGNYQAAIMQYEKVMKIEPGWVRAQEHRSEAEEYLRTGNIPSVALPAEAGKAYGKAQSAARVFRYQVALKYLDEAFLCLEDAGIKRWREGEELRQDLENQIQAGEVYQDGINLLKQGDLTGALSRIQTAASSVATPEYIDKATEIRSDLASLDEIGDVITSSGEVPAEKLAESKSKLEKIRLKYGDIPQVSRLGNRLDLIIPVAVKSLLNGINRLAENARISPTILNAKQTIKNAEIELDLLRQLDGNEVTSKELVSKLGSLKNDIDQSEDTLNRAQQAIKSVNRFFALDAWKMSKDVRNRYPSDPQVLELKKALIPFYATAVVGGLIALGLVILLLWFSVRSIGAAVEKRNLALTPTATLTPTQTLTPTNTLTPTLTPTITPNYTLTPQPTFTPTPIKIGLTARTLWARNGCYEAYKANGRIEGGSEVTLLPMDSRAFDVLNRECVLVEYRTGTSAIIGYILLADLTIP